MNINNNNEVLIAVISAASGILTVLGVGKIIPSIIKWLEKKRQDKEDNQSATKKEFRDLRDRISSLEMKLDKAEKFEIQTRTTLNSMIPLMKEMMKDHPSYIQLLMQLEKNIIGEDDKFSAQGNENND